ncbi:Ribosomal small subunit pseudouridine synthase A [gamma proteobacterium IMCC2047]|nr:Ribosomal small subunit pseudouridine synthase A [gamma proteobacterium IMCC2047]
MPAKSARLDRFISSKMAISQKAVRPILAQGRVAVDGCVCRDRQQIINTFSRITLDGQILQANTPLYLMMNKPKGVVSATRDNQYQTVIDLLDHPERSKLHLVGRLDFNSTGLLLLTNDSGWSQQLMKPDQKVSKRYRVTVNNPLDQQTVDAFAAGMYFAYEDATTRPAGLNIINDYEAEVTLTEGRYHQIKRMFARCNNKVLALHRIAIGNLLLDPSLSAGQSRELSAAEVTDITDQVI